MKNYKITILILLSSYSLFAQMLLSGKSKLGEKIISSSTLKLMTSNHLSNNFFPLEIKTFDQENTEDNESRKIQKQLGQRKIQNTFQKIVVYLKSPSASRNTTIRK